MKITRKRIIVSIIFIILAVAAGFGIWHFKFKNNANHLADRAMRSIRDLSSECRKMHMIRSKLAVAEYSFQNNERIQGFISVCIAASIYHNDNATINMIVEGGGPAYRRFIVTQSAKCREFIVRHGDSGTDIIMQLSEELFHFIFSNSHRC